MVPRYVKIAGDRYESGLFCICIDMNDDNAVCKKAPVMSGSPVTQKNGVVYAFLFVYFRRGWKIYLSLYRGLCGNRGFLGG